MSETNARQVPIAIVGMACIYPEARNLEQYWGNILHEVDCITDVPPSRWNIDDYFDPDPAAPDKTYCKRGGFLPEVDFDPIEFGLPPNILESTDTSQLLSLVVAKEALADAGYAEGVEFDRERTGVILGIGSGQNLIMPLGNRLQQPIWRRALSNAGVPDEDAERIVKQIETAYVPWTEDTFPGFLGNVISGRIASRFDLGGTNCVVDAACAATLSAATMAIDDLAAGRSDMMITGGVDTDNSIFMYMCFSKTPALTPGEHARPFDAESDGILIGEGIGMLVLKRLEDAERDGNRIYAVIRGIGSSSDGRSKSIYAPREEGQARALRRAYESANIDPATVSLVETHGTGTRAGDVCEVEALKQVFQSDRTHHIALGSVKSQIGHTKAAAGSAGLIKTALALHEKVLPPTLHVTTPNPKLGLESSPFYLNISSRPWFRTRGEQPRRAGVSAFGFGGTNFHFVLEEYQGKGRAGGDTKIHRSPLSIVLHAPSIEALVDTCRRTMEALERGERTLPDLAADATPVPARSPRIGFVARDTGEAVDLLKHAIARLQSGSTEPWSDRGIFYRNASMPEDARVVALFPGQGAQYVDMGRELALSFPEVREGWERVDDADPSDTITRKVFPPSAFREAIVKSQSAVLRQTQYAQPAIGAFSAGLFKALQGIGFEPDMAAGHSFGELTAQWAAGVLDDESFYSLSRARGHAMASTDGRDAGTMVAVKGDPALIQELLSDFPEVRIANHNSPNQAVVAGPTEQTRSAQGALEAKGLRCIPLPVSAAFHTPLVAHAQTPYGDALELCSFRSPAIPVYTNTTGEPCSEDAAKEVLKDQMLKPVLFSQMIERIHADGGFCFVEVGPGSVLTNLVRDILGNRPHLAVAVNANPRMDSDLQFRQVVTALRVAGLRLSAFRESKTEERNRAESRMSVRLSAPNYVSPKTQEKYQQTLREGRRIRKSQRQESTAHPGSGAAMTTNQQAPDRQMVEQLNHTLSQFVALETETLRVHEQYMQSHREYAQTFADLLRQQYALLGIGVGPLGQETTSQAIPQASPPVPTGVPVNGHTSPAGAYAVQGPPPAQTPPLPHNTAQTGYPAQAPAPPPMAWPAPPASIQTVQPQYYPAPLTQPQTVAPQAAPPVHAPVAPPPPSRPAPPDPGATQVNGTAPPPAVPESRLDMNVLKQSLIRITSETTGYPEDVIELDMNLEADLGIDSIKRVEILGAMMDAHPNLPQLDPEDLADLQTFSQIIEHLSARLGV